MGRHDSPRKLARSSGRLGLALLRAVVFLALALAAPPCWYFALRGKAGDRWTLAYAGAWTIFLGVIYASVLLNDRFGPF
jgi:hypothetical protein